jgi:hypothetical protein
MRASSFFNARLELMITRHLVFAHKPWYAQNIFYYK